MRKHVFHPSFYFSSFFQSVFELSIASITVNPSSPAGFSRVTAGSRSHLAYTFPEMHMAVISGDEKLHIPGLTICAGYFLVDRKAEIVGAFHTPIFTRRLPVPDVGISLSELRQIMPSAFLPADTGHIAEKLNASSVIKLESGLSSDEAVESLILAMGKRRNKAYTEQELREGAITPVVFHNFMPLAADRSIGRYAQIFKFANALVSRGMLDDESISKMVRDGIEAPFLSKAFSTLVSAKGQIFYRQINGEFEKLKK